MKYRIRRLAMTRSLAILASFALPIMFAACGGSTAPASTPAPAAKNVVVVADTVLSSDNVPPAQAQDRACVQTNRFPKNSIIVWRARVVDPVTGNLMDDKGVSKLQVKLANEKVLDMKYGAHPKTSQEFYWTVSWNVPMDQPTGTLGWTISATTGDGRTGEFKPLNVATTLLTITDETFQTIPK